MTPREVSEKGLYFRFGRQLQGGTSFWYPDKEQPDPENEVVIRDGDCGEVRSTRTILREEFDRRVRDYGLWRKVGMWDFVPAEDPAANKVAFCHRSPQTAGHMLHRYSERLRRLAWIVALYEAARVRMDLLWIDLDGIDLDGIEMEEDPFGAWWEGVSFEDLDQDATQEQTAELAFAAGRASVKRKDPTDREAYEQAVLRLERIRQWLPAPDLIE